jgi:hypothetical protein
MTNSFGASGPGFQSRPITELLKQSQVQAEKTAVAKKEAAVSAFGAPQKGDSFNRTAETLVRAIPLSKEYKASYGERPSIAETAKRATNPALNAFIRDIGSEEPDDDPGSVLLAQLRFSNNGAVETAN